MRLAVLTSGGKDSLFSAYVMQQKGFDISHFLTVLPESKESYMFHYPNVELTILQAEAADVELLTVNTKGEKEKELEDLKRLISKIKGDADGVIAGAIASEYQKKRVDAVCKKLGLKSFAPLWHMDPETLLRKMLEEKFEVIITSVSAMGLDEGWLGRKIDKKCIEDLISLNRKYKVHISGEGGEYETLVLDMPLFRKKLEIINARKTWEGDNGTYIAEEAGLIDKS